ncbi:MAG: glycosyltransferase family 4 protein [Theionarchaea archaeon]|nr:glycosyltransferase family 4 protein [Theionarchaea archaeon]
MRICYIHTADFRKHKGSSIHAKELVKHLSTFHTITLLVDRWDGSPLEGVRIVEMKCPQLCNVVWRVLYSIVYVTSILLSGSDLLYAKSPIEGSIAGFVGYLFRIPLIYEVNGLIEEEARMKGEGKFRVLTSSILEKCAINYAHHLISVTPWIKETLISRRVPDAKVTVIENGADPNLFQPVDHGKERLHLDPKTFHVGYVGTLKEWQGLDHVLAALPFILEEMPETKVLIVGGGELMDKLRQSIKDVHSYVTLTGEVSHEEVPLYISACDVCMLLKKPLSSGYSPLKLYEYLACERPVIASRVKGFECLEREKAGILVDQNNPQEVAVAAVTLLRDENLRKTMGKNGRAFVLNAHTWEKVAQEVSEVVVALDIKRKAR